MHSSSACITPPGRDTPALKKQYHPDNPTKRSCPKGGPHHQRPCLVSPHHSLPSVCPRACSAALQPASGAVMACTMAAVALVMAIRSPCQRWTLLDGPGGLSGLPYGCPAVIISLAALQAPPHGRGWVGHCCSGCQRVDLGCCGADEPRLHRSKQQRNTSNASMTGCAAVRQAYSSPSWMHANQCRSGHRSCRRLVAARYLLARLDFQAPRLAA